MAELTEERRKTLLAYCRIDAAEDGEDGLIQTMYDDAVGYMANAGVSIPKDGTDRRAQYDMCINHLVLDAYEHRNVIITGTIVAENPVFRRKLNQLKLTEPVPELGTGSGG